MSKTILITGASSGIGAATTLKFLNEGWNVALLARRIDKLKEVSSSSKNAICLACDVTSEDSVKQQFC